MYGDPLYVVLRQLYLASVHANAHWNVKPVQWRRKGAGAKPFELAPPLPQRRVRFRRSPKRSRLLASLRLASKWGASGAYRSADRAALRNGQLA